MENMYNDQPEYGCWKLRKKSKSHFYKVYLIFMAIVTGLYLLLIVTLGFSAASFIEVL